MVHPPPRLRASDERHPLTLDGLFEITHCCALPNACCACTHYLVFKEPTVAPRLGAFPPSVNDGPAKQLSRTTFRGTLRGYYPRLSLSITFCPKTESAASDRKTFICAAVWRSRNRSATAGLAPVRRTHSGYTRAARMSITDNPDQVIVALSLTNHEELTVNGLGRQKTVFLVDDPASVDIDAAAPDEPRRLSL